MQLLLAAICSVLFVAGAFSLPVDNKEVRQINPVGNNDYGSDTVPSMTDGSGNIVKFVNPAAASAAA